MHIRSVRAALTASLLVAMFATISVAMSVAAAPTAQAGGPTSAFLSLTGTGKTASLYYSDAEYDELGRLVGMNESAQTFAPQSDGADHQAGTSVTVTWLVHDVEPWRVDRIYLDGKGGPWISTQTSMGGSVWEAPVVWHQPAEGKRLIHLLGELGVTPKADVDSSTDGDLGASAVTTEPATQAPATVREQPATSTWRANAGWGAAGLVGGALLSLGWARVRQRHGGEPLAGMPVTTHEPRAEILAR